MRTLRLLITLWITQGHINRLRKALLMDPRLAQDVHRMSTDDLVLCYGILTGMSKEAYARGDNRMFAELKGRQRQIDDELGRRQLTIERELEKRGA